MVIYGDGSNNGSVPLAILVGLMTGVIVGAINGIVVAKFGLPPYLSTLAMQMILKGLAYLLPGLGPVYLSQATNFRFIAQTRIGGVLPITFIYVGGNWFDHVVLLEKDCTWQKILCNRLQW